MEEDEEYRELQKSKEPPVKKHLIEQIEGMLSVDPDLCITTIARVLDEVRIGIVVDRYYLFEDHGYIIGRS